VLLTAACSNGSSTSQKQEKSTEPERKLAGVFPDRFDCTTILKDSELAALLGAVAVNKIDNPSSVPRGIAQPCNYQVSMKDVMEAWSFDFDCRDGFKERADALFKQYKQNNAEMIEEFNKAADAGIKPTDGGPPPKAVEGAVEVDVGSKGLDHHGQAILFIDDDAPCYVRVNGPDQVRRLELAKAVAKNLTYANAPMTPRAFPDDTKK
jgi:hypothetical protein